jgi:hypothetical protein
MDRSITGPDRVSTMLPGPHVVTNCDGASPDGAVPSLSPSPDGYGRFNVTEEFGASARHTSTSDLVRKVAKHNGSGGGLMSVDSCT